MALSSTAARHILRAQSLVELQNEAERLLEKVKAAKARKKDRAPGAKGPTKEERRRERTQRAAKIRTAVFARAGDQCEFCTAFATYVPTYDPFPPTEWHHVLGGGERRAKERVDTTAAICVFCHAGWHKSDMDVLIAARVWAFSRGFNEALAAIDKRIDHVKAVRNTPSVPIRTETKEA